MKRRRFTKILKNNRGFSLVELIVAVLLMAMISTSLSSILGSTLSLYNRAEMNSLLYNVSQKLHIALDNELLTARDLTLYERAQNKPETLVKKEYQYFIQKDSDGYIYVYSFNTVTNKTVKEHILLSDKSYRGATVKELYFTYSSVSDKLNYSDTVLKDECMRIVNITTTIVKNGVEYTHTSTIRLYNMAVYGTELKIKLSSSSTAVVPNYVRSVKFLSVMYYATQFFEV